MPTLLDLELAHLAGNVRRWSMVVGEVTRMRSIGASAVNLALIDDLDDCFVVGEVNQQALFGRVAAVVHHGGAGTTTTAARAVTPQVVVPQAADQPYWAGRVADLGMGSAHDGPTPTSQSMSAALTTALTRRDPCAGDAMGSWPTVRAAAEGA